MWAGPDLERNAAILEGQSRCDGIGIDPFPHVDINIVTTNVNKTKRLSFTIERMKQKEENMEVDEEPHV